MFGATSALSGIVAASIWAMMPFAASWKPLKDVADSSTRICGEMSMLCSSATACALTLNWAMVSPRLELNDVVSADSEAVASLIETFGSIVISGSTIWDSKAPSRIIREVSSLIRMISLRVLA